MLKWWGIGPKEMRDMKKPREADQWGNHLVPPAITEKIRQILHKKALQELQKCTSLSPEGTPYIFAELKNLRAVKK